VGRRAVELQRGGTPSQGIVEEGKVIGQVREKLKVKTKPVGS